MTNESIKKQVKGLDQSDWDWMEKHWAGNHEQLYTHTSHETGEAIHVQVNKLNEALEKGRIVSRLGMMHLSPELYKIICETQGIERPHLDKISLDDAIYNPAIIIEFENGEHVIVDGNHKLVKSFELGLRTHIAIFVKESQIEPFLMKPPAKVAELLKTITKENVQLGDALLYGVLERIAQ